MDLLSPDNELDLSDLTWKIYTEDVTALPQYIGTEARNPECLHNPGLCN